MSAPRIYLDRYPSICQKIIKIGGNLTKFWQKQICLVFYDIRAVNGVGLFSKDVIQVLWYSAMLMAAVAANSLSELLTLDNFMLFRSYFILFWKHFLLELWISMHLIYFPTKYAGNVFFLLNDRLPKTDINETHVRKQE